MFRKKTITKTSVLKHNQERREKNQKDKKKQEKGRKMLAKLKEHPSRKEGYGVEAWEEVEGGLNVQHKDEDSDDEKLSGVIRS